MQHEIIPVTVLVDDLPPCSECNGYVERELIAVEQFVSSA